MSEPMTAEEKVLAWLNCNCIGNDNPSCENCPFAPCDDGKVEETIRNLIEDRETALVDMGEYFSSSGEAVRKWECTKCKKYVYTVLDATPKMDFCIACGRRVIRCERV